MNIRNQLRLVRLLRLLRVSDYFRTKLAASFDDRKLLIDLKEEINSEKRALKSKLQGLKINKGVDEHLKRQKFIKKNKDVRSQLDAIKASVDARLAELKSTPLQRSTDRNKDILKRVEVGHEFHLYVQPANKVVAMLYRETDGMYVADLSDKNGWAGWILKAIAAHLDELNWKAFAENMNKDEP